MLRLCQRTLQRKATLPRGCYFSSSINELTLSEIESPDLKYYAVNKPFDMLSQFTTTTHDLQKTLKSLPIPADDVYAAGRLDMDSEGLLILSNDNRFIAHLLNPDTTKEYIVQVDGEVDESKQLAPLLRSTPPFIEIALKHGKHKCRPMDKAYVLESSIANNFEPAPWQNSVESKLWSVSHVRKRKNKPTQFMQVAIRGGKNRQIRKMLAVVGLPVLRLVRVQIGNFNLLDRMEVSDFRFVHLFETLTL
jgi:23S rRNA pseudouridine2457 synthase